MTEHTSCESCGCDGNVDVGDRLTSMLLWQRDLQISAYGADPAQLPHDLKITFIKDMVMALEDELHEALGEVGWKPWATSRHINREAYVSELVDAWHFLMNLLLVAGVTGEEFYLKYLEKAKRNAQRQAEGYDGLTGKCYRCRRALDDYGTECRICVGEDRGYCQDRGWYKKTDDELTWERERQEKAREEARRRASLEAGQ